MLNSCDLSMFSSEFVMDMSTLLIMSKLVLSFMNDV